MTVLEIAQWAVLAVAVVTAIISVWVDVLGRMEQAALLRLAVATLMAVVLMLSAVERVLM